MNEKENLLSQIQLKSGAFVVFEGLDATGKSTQMLRLKKAAHGEPISSSKNNWPLFTEPPLFTHQPSGAQGVGEKIYKITEQYDELTPWTRQFLHLAAHTEHYEHMILPTLRGGRPVFMDRCWWSTFAYGYWPNEAIHEQMDEQAFLRIAQLPTQGRLPDLVLLFMEAYQLDRHNTDGVVSGYRWLEEHSEVPVKRMYGGTLEQVSLEIVIALCDAGLADPVS